MRKAILNGVFSKECAIRDLILNPEHLRTAANDVHNYSDISPSALHLSLVGFRATYNTLHL